MLTVIKYFYVFRSKLFKPIVMLMITARVPKLQ